MLRHKRGFRLAAASLLATMLLAACSNAGGGNAASDSGSQGQGTAGNSPQDEVKPAKSGSPVELTMWYRWPESQNAMQETIDEFHAANPNISVKLVSTPASQWTAQVQAAISGNELPDMFPGGSGLPLYQLAQLGVVHELDDLFTPDLKNQFFDGTWSDGYTTMDGKIYTVPNFPPRRYSTVLYYNKSVLAKAGITEAEIPKSWSDLEKACQKVKTNAGVDCAVMGIKTPWLNISVVNAMSSAGSPEVLPNNSFNYKTGKYEFNAPGIIDTMEFLKHLQDGKMLHPNSLVIDYREAANLFAGGKAAFFFDGTFDYSIFEQQIKFTDFGIAPLPTKDGKPQYWGFQGETTAPIHVNKNTKHYNEVKQFLRFAIDHYYPKLLKYHIDASPIVKQNETQIDSPSFKQAIDIQNKQFTLAPAPFHRNNNEIKVAIEMSGKTPKDTLGTVLEGYLAGQIPNLKEKLNQLNDAYNQVFQQAINKVQSTGVKVDASDYVFPNWTPLQPYTDKDYKELK